MRIFRRQATRTAAGVAIMAALLGLAVFIYALEDILGWFSSESTVVAVLPGAGTIVSGAPVWLAGREVGTVTRVALRPVQPAAGGSAPAHVVMDLAIPHELREQLRADAYARITSVAPIGEQAVDIFPGDPALPMLPAGDTLAGSPLPTGAELVAEAAHLRARLDSMLVEVREAAPGARTAMERYGRVAARARAAGSELASLRAGFGAEPAWAVLTSEAFDSALAGASGVAGELQPELEAFMARLDSVRAAARPVTDRMSARADTLARRLALLEAGLSAEGGILGRMRTDSALLKALHGAQAQLDSLIAEARADPLRFVF